MISLNNQTKTKTNKLIVFLLILSFVWVSLYPVLSAMTGNFYYNYGNLFNFSSPIFSNALIYIIVSALVSWIAFEVVFIAYRFLLGFKIYSFILPQNKFKNEARNYFIYRNIIFGLFLNICFIYPFLHVFVTLVDLVVTMTTFICFANHIKKSYSEPLIGHFVFKCFITPVVLYEILVVAISFMEVL